MSGTQLSIGRDAAIALAKTKWWEGLQSRDIAIRGLSIRELCIPFAMLHEHVEKALGRPVFTHEFASLRILDEVLGNVPAPTFDEIVAMIPEDKRILIVSEP